MRADMAKVIVERPRRKGYTTRAGRPCHVDDLPSTQGMRAPHVRHWGGKELNENLAPLKRFLLSRVGQPWDKVYSDISENLCVDSTVQAHVRDHVTDFVSVNCSMRDGKIWVHDHGVRPLDSSWSQMYVDPKDGLLKLNTEFQSLRQRYNLRKTAAQLAAQEVSRSVAGVELRKLKGIWYQVDVLPVPEVQLIPYTRADGSVAHREVGGIAYDVILECNVYFCKGGMRPLFGPYVTNYCAHKRQLNHAELKKYGVSND